MNLFLINVLLAVGFMIALESFTLQTLVAGLVVGYGALWLTRPLYATSATSSGFRLSSV